MQNTESVVSGLQSNFYVHCKLNVILRLRLTRREKTGKLDRKFENVVLKKVEIR